MADPSSRPRHLLPGFYLLPGCPPKPLKNFKMNGFICDHLQSLKVISPDKHFCEECVKTQDHWVHLRACQTCGVVLCCDSSPNQHATQHYRQSGHPVVISAEPGERWAWCYRHEKLAGY
jgi:uncharacterized UBP type Zn finger protein